MALLQQKDKWAQILMGIAVLIVFAGLVSYYVIAKYQGVVVEKKNKATEIARHLETHIDSRLTALELLAGGPEIRETNPAKVADELERAVRMLGFFNIVIFDCDGRFVAEAVPNSTIHTVYDESSFQSALSGRPTVSGRIIYNGLDSAYISLRVPIKNAQGNVKAVLAAGLPLNEISRIINEQGCSGSEYAFVIDAKLRFLHHPRFAEVYGRENGFSKYQDLFQNTNKEFIAVSEWDMTEKLYVFDEIGNTGWRVVVVTPISAIYSAVLKSSLLDIGIFLLLIISIGLLYYIISQAKRHEIEMENLRFERLICASQMAAGIAHEIRNPLTSIKGFIQLIMRKIDQPPPKSYLNIIYGEIERIEKLIYEFQMLARPLKPAHFCEIDMAKTVNDVVLLMETQALAKKASLVFNCCKDYQVYRVMGDEAQLKQVLINLVRNAIEAVDAEGKIILSLSIKEGMVAITVSDNGTGIPQEVLVKLGTPFYTTKESGTGLGLSVCYSIVQNHNGRFEVTSKVGEGTSFTVLLPYAASAGMN